MVIYNLKSQRKKIGMGFFVVTLVHFRPKVSFATTCWWYTKDFVIPARTVRNLYSFILLPATSDYFYFLKNGLLP